MDDSPDFPAVELVNGIKIFEERGSKRKISALRGCDLLINKGELISIIGPSGAGKTTLLRIIAGLEELSSGDIRVGGLDLHDMSKTLRQEFRRKYIGAFTQFGRQNFDPKMKVHEAITWETLLAGWKPKLARERTKELLQRMELSHLTQQACGKLSAGEAMRVSLLKAIAKKPLIILADEPSGQLDTENLEYLYKLMREILNEETAILVATHDVRFQALSDRSLLILDGKLASEEEGAELLSRRSMYFDALIQEQDLISSRLFVDSNNSIRIPDSIMRRLGIGKQVNISHSRGDDTAAIHGIENPEIIEQQPHVIHSFSRKNIIAKSVIQLSDVSKTYFSLFSKNEVLEGVNFDISEGDFVVLLGPSGSGKTTLLNMIAGLENVTSGLLTVKGYELQKSFISRQTVRLADISYLTQNFIAHPYLNVEENAKLPYILKTGNISKDDKKYLELVNSLELANYQKRLPSELSGGQQQRSSLLGSILKDTPIMLADEPTANLDAHLAITVMNELIKLAESGKTVIIATHDYMLVQPGFRIIRISDKNIVEDIIADEKYCLELQKQYLLA